VRQVKKKTANYKKSEIDKLKRLISRRQEKEKLNLVSGSIATKSWLVPN